MNNIIQEYLEDDFRNFLQIIQIQNLKIYIIKELMNMNKKSVQFLIFSIMMDFFKKNLNLINLVENLVFFGWAKYYNQNAYLLKQYLLVRLTIFKDYQIKLIMVMQYQKLQQIWIYQKASIMDKMQHVIIIGCHFLISYLGQEMIKSDQEKIYHIKNYQLNGI
ncbi:unnamed protein product [Paramecium sonneborni]|uniref:Uncharacterized protein n=1 Tax=Paramecium sonneborni TaxID=65129 RepID=A0A8S1RNJ5_9CILI|nr:unnamed protein product [Paramecium sonneborni]